MPAEIIPWLQLGIGAIGVILAIVVSYIKIYMDFNRRMDEMRKDIMGELRPMRDSLGKLNGETGRCLEALSFIKDEMGRLHENDKEIKAEIRSMEEKSK